jgi:hypothetical protein
VQDLRLALGRLAAAEEMKRVALQMIRQSLPAVEGMVQQSTAALAAHADFCPSLADHQGQQGPQGHRPGRAVAQSNRDNQSVCTVRPFYLRLCVRAPGR